MTEPNSILIIDDCEIYQAAMKRIVEKAGYTAEICSDGMQAMIRTNQNMEGFVAILLDIYMPEIDGISLLGHLRSKYPHIPVYVLSGSMDPEDKEAVLNLGAVDFIQKPLDAGAIDVLIASLKNKAA